MLRLFLLLATSTCPLMSAASSSSYTLSMDHDQPGLFERVKKRFSSDDLIEQEVRRNVILGAGMAIVGLTLMALGAFALGSFGFFIVGYVINATGGIMSIVSLFRLRKKKSRLFKSLGISGTIAFILATAAILPLFSLIPVLTSWLRVWISI